MNAAEGFAGMKAACDPSRTVLDEVERELIARELEWLKAREQYLYALAALPKPQLDLE